MEEGWIGRWSPGIGDPTVGGWVTVVAYFAAAWLCFRVYRQGRAQAGPGKRGALPWLLLAGVLAMLGVNKQLDLQTALTEVGRILAHEQGWYRERRAVQRVFVRAVAFGGLLATLGMLRLARGDLRRLALPVLGLGVLATFIAIRAASFHHVDHLLGVQILGLRVNWVLELGGISLIATGAYRALERPIAPVRSTA